MKITILQENLSKGLTTVSRSVASKATLPVLANILLKTDKGQLKLSATNLEVGVNIWLGAKIESEGGITIPARIFSELVSSLPAEKIELEAKENILLLSSGNFTATLSGISPTEFPQIPSFSPSEEILSFIKEELVSSLSSVVFAAASDEGRPVLTGVLLKSKNSQISLVATDGYRLSVKKLSILRLKQDLNLLIPAKTLVEVSRISQEKKDEEKEIKISLMSGGNQIVFALPQVELSSRLIEGEFPDFEKIIPTSSSTKVTLDKEEFLRAIKIASIFAREQTNIVKLKIDPSANGGKLKIAAETPQVGTNESELMVKSEGEDLEIAFNYRFLLDFLNALPGEEIIFEASGPLTPGVFRVSGDESLLHIIMPVRIQA